MSTTPVPRPRRALVLGGGGSAGNAWLIGVIAGLSEGGMAVTEADLVIGTSAGATAAAQIAGASPGDLLAGTLDTPPPPSHPHPGPPPGAGRATWMDHLERTNAIIAASADLADMRRRAGANAVDLATEAGESARVRWRETVAARLPSPQWPAHAVHLAAVDADTGDPVVFDRDSGIDLVDAVAASCAGGPAYRIGSRNYIDGGYRRSSENADLAGGCERVLVLSPLGGRTRHPAAWRSDLATQVDELRAGGSRVETVLPDAASLAAFGDNMMSFATRAPAARAGHDQGRRLAQQLVDLWT
ncbi:patatin-like phospholipase family protein [Nocardioides albus]|uniref:NTE family protein n=1 Tax=Nocardioides albus TaxID=1841 RepID=A0A7W5A598_9ACTN|nr:patatin-like phospholipase family protein [Nocardioides albus]MBB3089504.1 NTE family protein [Nocardioides albus]GGU31283.1 patatin [Nocardioides albus]